ncbi:MAG: tetratricopeptide repeat protein [Moheibacter sp.]
MNTRIQHLIKHPFEVGLEDVAILQDEIDKYPYFSTLRTLLLFGLKEHNHTSFGEELKKVSIHCPSRVALYHYLQKEKLESSENSMDKVHVQQENIQTLTEPEVVPSVEETSVASVQISSENNLDSEKTEGGQEIDTSLSEFTFSEWLHLSKTQDVKNKSTPTEKDIKFQLIDEFIEKSPKISPIGKLQETTPSLLQNSTTKEYSDLMTETLAQIYTEQKKYDKAVRAYRILALKYPDKSEEFTEKIQEIEGIRDSR